MEVKKLRIIKHDGDKIEEDIKVLTSGIEKARLFVVQRKKDTSIVEMEEMKRAISKIAGPDDQLIFVPEGGDISVYSFELVEEAPE